MSYTVKNGASKNHPVYPETGIPGSPHPPPPTVTDDDQRGKRTNASRCSRTVLNRGASSVRYCKQWRIRRGNLIIPRRPAKLTLFFLSIQLPAGFLLRPNENNFTCILLLPPPPPRQPDHHTTRVPAICS